MGRCRVTFALSLYMLISPNPWNLLFSSASREFEGYMQGVGQRLHAQSLKDAIGKTKELYSLNLESFR